MHDGIRVGLIGANPDRGWAMQAHVPAIAALPEYRLTAVATSRAGSAKAAAAKWGAGAAYTDARALAGDPEVDLVVVCVKCPDHRVAVTAAIEAGKPVLCEWPLSPDLQEAAELAVLARKRAVRSFVGLQARFAPAIEQARDLVRQGYVGRVLSATLLSAGSGMGGVTDLAHAYAADDRSGNSVVSVAGGHALDALCFVLGEFAEVGAVTAARYDRVRIVETGETVAKTAPDQLTVAGTLRSGTVVAAHIQAGVSRGPGVQFDIRGTEGDLRLSSSGPAMLQMAALGLYGARGPTLPGTGGWSPLEELPSPDASGAASNIERLYAAIANDLRRGSMSVPDFAVAAERHRLLDAIGRAARSGQRQRVGTIDMLARFDGERMA